MKISEQVAIVTGAGSGLGRAMALGLARKGAKVVIAEVREENAKQVSGEIQASGGKAAVFAGDLSQERVAQQLIDFCVQKFGRLDILINNAGITRDGLTTRIKDGELLLMSDEKWDAVLEVNLKGTWLCMQLAAVPMMKQKYGRIVNTASVSALGNIGQVNYSASKAGVMGVTRTLALEWARFGIAVNCVAPGGVRTQMTAAIPEKLMEGLLRSIPYGRLAEPEEIAAVHAFLASDSASYITGQVLFVDGGLKVGA